MLSAQITSDIAAAEKALGRMKRQVPFAAAMALTKTAKKVEQVEKAEMQQVFNNPTRYTLNAQFVKPATKRNLESIVWLKGSDRKRSRHYLQPHVDGGDRANTGFEMLLIKRGIMASGYKAIPGQAMKKSSRGGITRGTYQKVLAQLGAFQDPMQNSTGSTRSTGKRKPLSFFVVRGNFYGIMAREGKRIYPAFIFVKSTRYSKRFNFHKVAAKVSAKYWPTAFNRAISKAIKTAR